MFFYSRQICQFFRQLKRRQYGIFTGQRYIGFARQALVRVQPRFRHPEFIELHLVPAFQTQAVEFMRLLD